MIKIAFYLPNFELGGVQRRTIRLLAGLSNTGLFEIHLFVNTINGPLRETVPDNISILLISGKSYLSNLAKLRSYLIHNKYRIVICCMGQDFIRTRVAACLLPSALKPAVSIIQAVPVILPNQSIFSNFIRRIAILIFYPFAHMIICVSNDVRDSLIQLHSRLKLNSTVIYNPVVSEQLDVLAKAPVHHKFFLSGNKIVIAVGRVHVQKDYPTLIQAFHYAYLKDGSIRLLILGGGNTDELVRYIGTFGANFGEAVDVLGQVENPFPYVANSDLFVMSSLWEGLPNALIEAMYLGKPVISTDCRSGPKEILKNGELGALVEVGDWKSMGEQLFKMTRNDSILAGYKLRARAGQFSIHEAVSKYCEYIRNIS